MVNQSIINHSSFVGILRESSVLRPQGGESRSRPINAELLLTALIDAFSILVIFLLMSFSSSGEIVYIGKDQELPKAARADTLERHPLVKIEDRRIFVEEKQVAPEGLVEALLAVRKTYQEAHPGEEFPGIVTVQADRRIKYEVLNSVVLASSHAGFSDIKFAVIMK